MSSTAVLTPDQRPVGSRRPVGRWEATGIALAWVLLFGPVLALFVVNVVAIPLVLVTAGVILLLGGVPLLAGIAGVHRRLAGRVLGERITVSYDSTDGQGVFGRLQVWMRDRARWRGMARRREPRPRRPLSSPPPRQVQPRRAGIGGGRD